MTNSQSSDINAEDDLFYFESDHLALRGNKDYSDVLKNLLILCAQRKKSLENYNKTVELKKEALADPSSVLEKIVKGESLGVPDLCRVPDIPVIDWTKYNTRIPEESLKEIYADDNNAKPKKKNESPKKEQEISHKRWTTEEQKRLEELLQVYPPEPVELRRFKKIADALGNRTIQQVTSRVQKYFVKLYKAGLPIPGRIPKSAERYKRGITHKHQRHNHYLWKPTTFFPDLCVPVVMSDLDDAPGPSTKPPNSFENEQQPTTSSNYLIPTGYHEGYNGDSYTEKSENELQLDLLKRIRKTKIKENSENFSNSTQYHHLGFKCDFCSEEPIVGTRWHCISCKTESVDFCTDCALAQMYSENSHNLKHKLVSYTGIDGVESESEQECLNHNETSDESSEDEDSDAMSESDVSLPTEKKLNNIPEEEFTSNNSLSTNYNDTDFDGFLDTYPTGSDLFDDIDNIAKFIEKH